MINEPKHEANCAMSGTIGQIARHAPLPTRHIGGWSMYRDSKGWPCWHQRCAEAWWVITGKWSLHRAWQAGHDHGTNMEYQRTVVNGGR